MSSFEKLLTTVRNANLISEEDATAMLADYNKTQEENLSKAVDAASGSAFKEGYEQGFNNAKQQADAETKKALDELLKKCDEEASTKLQAVIETLNKEHSDKLQEVYDILKANTVPLNEVQAMDDDHAKKFVEAIEAKDADCTKKLKIACEAIQKKANKYIAEREKFNKNKFIAYKLATESKINAINTLLKSEKAHKLNVLTESVEKYLNYALQNAIPSKTIISEAKYNASQKTIEKISSILKINSILQESKDGIFKDYENQIQEAKDQSNKLLNENINLKHDLETKEAKLLLESKITNCTPAEASFLRSFFSKATSPKIIEEQIDDARNAFKRLHNEKHQNIVTNTKSTLSATSLVSESKAVKKNEPSKKVVTESVENTKSKTIQSINEIYADILKSN